MSVNFSVDCIKFSLVTVQQNGAHTATEVPSFRKKSFEIGGVILPFINYNLFENVMCGPY